MEDNKAPSPYAGKLSIESTVNHVDEGDYIRFVNSIGDVQILSGLVCILAVR